MSRKNKKKRKPDWMLTPEQRIVSKDRTRESVEEECSIRLVLKMHGLDLVVSWMQIGSRQVPHWRFLKRGFCLMHYWPSNGRYRTADGAMGFLMDMHKAGLLARYMALETDPSEDAELAAAGLSR